jgi:AcrR family transcriptional regulator
MNTKDKIIRASIELFNIHGVTKISLRDIANKIGISHGNLAYHFKNKQWIIDEIYTRMEKEMDDVVFPGGNLSLRHYHNLLKEISDFQKRYRFFYMDMLEITRRYPKVIERYRNTITKRGDEKEQLLKHFIEMGLVKTEPEPGFYRSLFHSIWVMSTFWLQHKKILGEDHPTITSGSDIRHVWEILLPHLTDKGLKEYRVIISGDDPPVEETRPIQKVYLKKID